MLPSRRGGLICAGVAGTLWVTVVILIATTLRGGGANIGAGLLGLLAIALSVLAAVLLARAADNKAIRVSGVASAVAWAVFLGLPAFTLLMELARLAFGGVALVALRHQHRPDA